MTTKRKTYKTYSKEFKLEAIRLMEESELSKVKQELQRLKEENEILKKAAVFFAKELD